MFGIVYTAGGDSQLLQPVEPFNESVTIGEYSSGFSAVDVVRSLLVLVVQRELEARCRRMQTVDISKTNFQLLRGP